MYFKCTKTTVGQTMCPKQHISGKWRQMERYTECNQRFTEKMDLKLREVIVLWRYFYLCTP